MRGFTAQRLFIADGSDRPEGAPASCSRAIRGRAPDVVTSAGAVRRLHRFRRCSSRKVCSSIQATTAAFGGIRSALARAALRVLIEEDMIANAAEMGGRPGTTGRDQQPPVKEVRGRTDDRRRLTRKAAARAASARRCRSASSPETHHNIIRFALIITGLVVGNRAHPPGVMMP